MSNRHRGLIDTGGVRRPGGTKWIRVWGVDFVMRRRNCKAGTIGATCVAIAVLTAAIAITTDTSLGTLRASLVIVASGQIAIIGVMLMCYQGLLHRTSSSQELYRVGYDIGHEDGYAEGQQEPVVIDITGRRKASVNHG